MKRRLLALLAVSLVAAAPGVPSRYDQAVAARLAGDQTRAISILRGVVLAELDNADAHLQLGLALLARGDLDAAEASFRRTLEIAPDYQDAKDGLARVAERRAGDKASATRWQLNLDGSYSALHGGTQPDWKEGAAQLRYEATPDTALAASVELSRRFGVTDVYGEMRVDHRFADGVNGYVSIGGTPDADFRPEHQIGAGGSARVHGGTNATSITLDVRQARYRSGDIQTVSPGVEQYLAGGRAWVTARWINIFDETGEHRSGWLGRGDVMASDRLRLFAGASDAPDVSEGVVVDTFSLFGGISYDVDEHRTLRLSVAHEDRAQGTDRLQFGFGLGWRF